MIHDEIIEMPPYLNASYEGDDLYTGDQVRELMKLVAAKEREACAKECEHTAQESDSFTESILRATATQIRARGEQA